MPTSPRFGLTQLVEGQASGETTANEYLAALEIVQNGKVLDRDLATPPGSPANGDLYIVAASPTGAWTGWAGRLAYYLNGWKSIVPASGMVVFVHDEKVPFMYSAVESLWFPLVAKHWSGTEYFTGTYRNGQKIFAKVFTFASPTAGTTNTQAHSISGLNVTRGVTFEGFAYYSGVGFPVPINFTLIATSFEVFIDGTYLSLVINGAVAPTSVDVLVTYAKS